MEKNINDRLPNFIGTIGRFFLVRCFVCGGKKGRKNRLDMLDSGKCAWCGWDVAKIENGREKTTTKQERTK